MKALVVYESFWGNTKAVAEAIAEGIGSGTQALRTEQATREMLAGVDLLVVGAPLMAFSLPTEQTRQQLPADKKAPRPADISHLSMRKWLESISKDGNGGAGKFATFETGFKWSPGSAAGVIERGLTAAGYRRGARKQRFRVGGSYGPMKDGEIERARAWGAELAKGIS